MHGYTSLLVKAIQFPTIAVIGLQPSVQTTFKMFNHATYYVLFTFLFGGILVSGSVRMVCIISPNIRSVTGAFEKSEQKISAHLRRRRKKQESEMGTSSRFHYMTQYIPSYFVIEFLYQLQCEAYSCMPVSVTMSLLTSITI